MQLQLNLNFAGAAEFAAFAAAVGPILAQFGGMTAEPDAHGSLTDMARRAANRGPLPPATPAPAPVEPIGPEPSDTAAEPVAAEPAKSGKRGRGRPSNAEIAAREAANAATAPAPEAVTGVTVSAPEATSAPAPEAVTGAPPVPADAMAFRKEVQSFIFDFSIDDFAVVAKPFGYKSMTDITGARAGEPDTGPMDRVRQFWPALCAARVRLGAEKAKAKEAAKAAKAATAA